MTSRTVRATEIKRLLDGLQARGEKPAAYTLLPGGAVRFHMTEPAANDAGHDIEAEARKWDEALGG